MGAVHGLLAGVTASLVWASAALPGSTHDPPAAQTHGIPDALTTANVMTFAAKAYRGAGGTFARRSNGTGTGTGRSCYAGRKP